MKTEIIHLNKRELFTDSKIIAEMLEVKHSDLIRTINSILDRQKNSAPPSGLKFPQKFIESSFVNKMGREYKMYELNEQAYMKLAMHLKGYEKAEFVQDSIIEAFSLMKEALLNQQNSSWLNARNRTKEIRKEETDCIFEFIKYAIKQGSQNADRYYSNITKMTNKALELLVQVKTGAPLRDLVSATEQGFIQMLDNRAKQAIEYGMEQNLPYKYIYKYAKEEVNKLADSLNFKKQLK
jgi:phage regulator Rha-like protein